MTESIRVLDLRDSPWVDGPGRTILDTAQFIGQYNIEVVIGGFVSGNGGKNVYLEAATERGLQVQPIDERSGFDVRALGGVSRSVRNLGIDIIHAHDFRSNIISLICSRRERVPAISTCHGWIANNFKGRVYRSVDIRTQRFLDHSIAVSEAIKGRLLNAGVPAGNITVVPNALVIEDFIPAPDDHRFRQELGVDRDTTLMVSIGRLSPEKGHDVLLDALADLKAHKVDYLLAIVGIGNEEQSIRAMVSDRGLEDQVRLVGFQHDMSRIYNSADLVVQSSFTEGMPNVILESLLMTTPVVATAVGGTAEIIEHDVTGCLVRPRSSEAILQGLLDYFRSPERYKSMAVQGRSTISKRFDHRNRVRNTADIYKNVAGRGES